MTGHRDVAVIGAGQAGLAMSACLSAAEIDHLVLERGRVGERWRSERWQSLHLLTPNWMTRLPGPAPAVRDREGFMSSGRFVRELETYSHRFDAPLLTRTAVETLAGEGSGYIVHTTSGSVRAKAVVIATGACDSPTVPDWSANVSRTVRQITPKQYKGPDSVAPGGVLVVGASATGTQIALELQRAGIQVTLSVGRHVPAPRLYRGRDLYEWLDASGFLAERTARASDLQRLRAQPSFQLCGSRSDGELGLATLSAEGVKIVGRALGASGNDIHLGQDLAEQCLAAERRRRKLLAQIDSYISDAGLAVPVDADASRIPDPLPAGPSVLNLRAERIGTILWATGYRRAYPWLRVGVLDPEGEIRNAAGITPAPGLFVLGLPYQCHRASHFIDGVGRDAEALLPAVANHLGARFRAAA